ncbi:hypothetical protein GCM10025789_09130 [Tessaracoccus lubricantis]|uniref:Uncharacterized protein n=1 Tax=Tessaracoccus lubricantis TaxID=545543 RepID=A0ABP9F6J8_9ACTN
MSESHDARAGRPIRLAPVAPGFWATTLGVALAALAPLFGFLVGVMSQSPTDDVILSPLYVGLFTGVILGGIGVAVAVAGGVRLWRHLHREDVAGPVVTEATEGGAA